MLNSLMYDHGCVSLLPCAICKILCGFRKKTPPNNCLDEAMLGRGDPRAGSQRQGGRWEGLGDTLGRSPGFPRVLSEGRRLEAKRRPEGLSAVLTSGSI